MSFFQPQNPGLGGLDELTAAEELFLTSLAGLSYSDGDILYFSGGTLTNLTIGNEGDVLTVSSGNPSWSNSSGGSGIAFETPTGTVNGVNVTFTVLNDPIAIVIDGMWKFEGAGYSYSSPTITVSSDNPPVQFIRSAF